MDGKLARAALSVLLCAVASNAFSPSISLAPRGSATAALGGITTGLTTAKIARSGASRPASGWLHMFSDPLEKTFQPGGIKSVAIVGGSFGGLATALALQNIAGFGGTVTVYEGDTEKTWRSTETGHGVEIPPHAMKCYELLSSSLCSEVKAASAPVLGTLLARDLDAPASAWAAVDKDAKPWYSARWARVRAAMASHLPSTTRLRFSFRFRGIETMRTPDGKVVALFEKDGQKVRVVADLLIVANGAESKLREEFVGEEATKMGDAIDTSRTTFCGITEHAPKDVWPEKHRYSALNSNGDSLVACPAGEGHTRWAVHTSRPQTAFGAPDAASLEKLACEVEGTHPALAHLIRSTPSACAAAVPPRRAQPPVFCMGRGGVGLVGDAAHPLDPSLGEGAALALEDAVQLAYCFRKHSEVGAEAVVGSFCEERKERVGTLMAASLAAQQANSDGALPASWARVIGADGWSTGPAAGGAGAGAINDLRESPIESVRNKIRRFFRMAQSAVA